MSRISPVSAEFSPLGFTDGNGCLEISIVIGSENDHLLPVALTLVERMARMTSRLYLQQAAAMTNAIPNSALQFLKCDALDLRADTTSLDLSCKGLNVGDAELLAAAMAKFMGSLTQVLAFSPHFFCVCTTEVVAV